MKKILFVCTGNTCRSPMAEALFNHIVNDEEYKASSCGIYSDGSPISKNAKEALKEYGIDFSHTSTQVSDNLLYDADYIIGMTANHAQNLISMFPQYADKTYAMPIDIADPYGGNIDVYRNCRDEIEKCVTVLIETLKGDNNG